MVIHELTICNSHYIETERDSRINITLVFESIFPLFFSSLVIVEEF